MKPAMQAWVGMALLASAAFGGDLMPPGAPAATMKTLDQIEARKPISSIPFTIGEPGSYYLTQDLGPGAEGLNGITIQANNVTLDLNGFTITGPGKESPGFADGIVASAANSNIAVFNGAVCGWPGAGINLASPGTIVHHIRAQDNGTGINGNASASVTDCACQGNGTGINYAGRIVNNICSTNAVGINAGSVITGNYCGGNTDAGIKGNYGAVVTENVCENNGGDGIFAYGGATVTKNCCRNNQGDGIEVDYGSTVSGNNCSINREDGVQALSSCRITENTCWVNGNDGDGAGVHVTGTGNTIQQNHCTQNDRGLDVDSFNNYSCQNTLSNNTTAIEGTHTQGAGDLANVSF
jgi:hypothetical protein